MPDAEPAEFTALRIRRRLSPNFIRGTTEGTMDQMQSDLRDGREQWANSVLPGSLPGNWSPGFGLFKEVTTILESAMKSDSETTTLISSEKVAGTAVYNSAGEALGSVEEIMLDKRSGTAKYAIMSFGGFLGMGSKYHPLPWSLLKYDTEKGGYVVNLDKRQLEGAPAYDEAGAPEWSEDYGHSIFAYYGVPPL